MEELNRLARSIPNTEDLNSRYVEYGPDGLPGNNRDIIKLFRVHDYLYRHDVEDYDKHLADDLLVRCMTAFGHKDIARKMEASLANYGNNFYRQKRRPVVDTPIVGLCREENEESFWGMVWKLIVGFLLMIGLMKLAKRS